MADAGHRGRWRAIAIRVFRWEPKNYWQVWLTSVPFGVIWFVIWSARGELLAGLAAGGIMTLVAGAAGSYRLGRRRDASTVAEWTSTRRLPPPEP